MADRCKDKTKDSQPCSARPLPGRDVCAWHCPEWAHRRREWSAEGGRKRSNTARATKRLGTEALTLADLHVLLSRAARALVAGELEPGPANALANLARSIESVARSAELESKISELERLIAERAA